MKSYSKPALTLDEQVEQLRSRGMQIRDEAKARHYLGYINYYRLGAYWLPFELDHESHQFRQGTEFDEVLNRYVFDRELRLLLIDAIERVEVAIRTRFAYSLGHAYGAHALLNANVFHANQGRWNYSQSCSQLQKDAMESKEIFMVHLSSKYIESLPPVWAAVEIMTLGQLSKWYANLRQSADRNRIANAFDFDEINLVSFLHHLAIVRNYCAHHNRLWNRDFGFTFKLPRKRPSTVVGSINSQKPKKIYNTLAVLACLLDVICPGHHWKQRLKDLLEKYPVPESDIGFPDGWRELPLWQEG